MNRAEAKQAIEAGKKVTHRYFDKHEFVTLAKDKNGKYEFEDGNFVLPDMFWTDRGSDHWNEGWSIFTKTT